MKNLTFVRNTMFENDSKSLIIQLSYKNEYLNFHAKNQHQNWTKTQIISNQFDMILGIRHFGQF